jgi:hypothetical protein
MLRSNRFPKSKQHTQREAKLDEVAEKSPQQL